MKPKRKDELKEKGWDTSDIKNAEEILERSTRHDVFLSTLVFWSALVVIIFANVVVSFVLVPFLVVFDMWVLYTIIILLAGVVGFLYHFLISDIGHLETKHHILASIIVPVLALANMIVVVVVSNRCIEGVEIKNIPHNPYIIAIVFAVAFILPTIVLQIKNKITG